MYTLSYKETHSGAFFAQQEPYVFSTVLLYTFWHEHKAGMLIYILADQMEKAEQWTFWIKVRAIFVTCPKRDFMDQHLTKGIFLVDQWPKGSATDHLPLIILILISAAQQQTKHWTRTKQTI